VSEERTGGQSGTKHSAGMDEDALKASESAAKHQIMPMYARPMRKGADAKVTKTLLESRTEKTAMDKLSTLVSVVWTQRVERYLQDVGNEFVEEDVAKLLSGVVEEGEDTGGLQIIESATARRNFHSTRHSLPGY
jgi:hypothetical protein